MTRNEATPAAANDGGQTSASSVRGKDVAPRPVARQGAVGGQEMSEVKR
jgi:hypothetical protein